MSSTLNKTVADGVYTFATAAAQEVVKKEKFDKTISAQIIEVVDATIGKYRVKYQDANFCAYSENTSVTYKKGVMVNILIPGGDMTSENKQILGATTRQGIDYVDSPEFSAKYIKNGGGCINPLEEILSIDTTIDEGKLEKEFILYQKGNNNSKLSFIDEVELNNYLQNAKHMLFSCDIKTAIPKELQYAGKYGIKIQLRMDSDVEKPDDFDCIKTFYFTADDVVGTPYNLPVWSLQEKAFAFEGETFKEIIKISLFVEGFPQNHKGIIYFRNLNLFGATMLDSSKLSTYAVEIAAEKGKFFSEKNKKTTLPLTAKVYIKGKLAKKAEQAYKIYWFVKNARITSNHAKYHKVGNIGWECLNDSIAVNDGPSEWLDGNEILNITQECYPAKETTFKCVIVYDNQSFSSEITVHNTDFQCDLILKCDQEVHFSNDLGEATLTLIFKDKNGEIPQEKYHSYSYHWNKVYLDGSVEYLEGKQNEANSGLSMNPYLVVPIKEINAKSVFNCSVYSSTADGSGQFLGTASITLFNENKAQEYTLVIVNGKQSFKYDIRGNSPTSEANEHPTQIQELSFVIYDRMGQQIKEDVIDSKVQGIRWKRKDTSDTLLKTLKESKEEQRVPGFKTVDNDKTLNIQIKDKFSHTASYNQIELEMRFYKTPTEDYSLTATTEFVFTKEGAQGTNGTESVCWVSHPDKKNGFIECPVGMSDNYSFEDKLLTVQSNGEIKNSEITILKRSIKGNTSNQSFFTLSKEGKLLFNIASEEYITRNNSLLSNVGNIIQGQATFADNKIGFNTVPIVTTLYPLKTAENNSTKLDKINIGKYRFKYKPYTGFLNVEYATNGKFPQYDTDAPFEIECVYEDTEKGKIVAVPWVEGVGWKIDDTTTYTIEWKCTNQFTQLQKNNISNKCKFVPKDVYDGFSYVESVWANIKKGDSTIATVHIPIYCYINRYFNADINDWNGNGIEINEESGMILSPQVGAGYKNEKTNAFTGVIIGTKENYSASADEKTSTGLFGFHDGQQTIFLDATTGKSEFGAAGEGQIIIDPSTRVTEGTPRYIKDDNGNFVCENNKYIKYDETKHKGQIRYKEEYRVVASATIKSGNYDYDPEKKTGTSGMCIDVARPEIRYGSGNFVVSPQGHITAKGGGEIAGWLIDDYKIYKDNTGMSSVTDINNSGATKETLPLKQITKDKNGNDIVTVKSIEETVAFWAGPNDPKDKKFFVTHNGNLRAKEAIIGDGSWGYDISNNKVKNDTTIHIGGSTVGKTTHSAIYSGKSCFHEDIDTKKTSNGNFEYYPTQEGFYLGADGFAIGRALVGTEPYGNAFEVSKNGQVRMMSGTIGLDPTNATFSNEKGKSHNYWTIDGNAIKYNNKSGYNTDEEGIYIGTDGIGFGKRGKEDTTKIASRFYVDSNGSVVANDVTVYDGGFKITSLDDKDDKAAFYAYIDSETKESWVQANRINAVGGYIGGWTIEAEQLKAGNLVINSNGSISASGGDDGSWSISSSGAATFSNVTITGGSVSVGDTTIDSTGIDIPSGKTGFKVGGTAVPIAASSDNGETFLELDYLKTKSLVCDAGRDKGYTKIGPNYLLMGINGPPYAVHCELKGVEVPRTMYILINGQRYDVKVEDSNVYNVVRQREDPIIQKK